MGISAYYKLLLRDAYRLAVHSTDTSTKLGALIVSQYNYGEILAWGVNKFTDPSQYDDPRNYERPRKYQVTEHAERSAIYSAARHGIATEGRIMICPWASCPDCARAIVKAGISKLVGHKQALDKTPERWQDVIRVGFEILAGGGVEYVAYDGDIGGVENLFDGEIWLP